jgi:hypothetical protein
MIICTADTITVKTLGTDFVIKQTKFTYDDIQIIKSHNWEPTAKHLDGTGDYVYNCKDCKARCSYYHKFNSTRHWSFSMLNFKMECCPLVDDEHACYDIIS